MRLRTGVERLSNPFDNYALKEKLLGIPLSQLSVIDPGFTIEQIATRVEYAVYLPTTP